ncbi:MAG: bifunctional 4-hydroxy-2-oxoglutarate aldolase/2-dehydro-3-deoxy-phosphogluconate aldolase [Isosphaeraceae bacterium]
MASDTLSRILDCGIVAVVRSEKPDQLIQVVEALASGGVTAAEITFTVPEADRVIREVRKALGDRIILGAGTVLDSETARTAILAGAEYLVTPCVNLDVIRLAKRYGKVVMPGGFTPTECLTAWEAGADIVKVFPADVVGPAFFKAMKGPLPQIRLMPTGGVDLTTAESFLKAGACCLGVGSNLVEPKAVAAGDFARLESLASQYVEIVRKFRSAN